MSRPFAPGLNVILHGTIRNDDFKRNTGFQCWYNVAATRNNVARNVATLYYAKNRRCKLSRVTSPYD